MPSFLLPSLCLIALAFAVLLTLKTFFKEILPSNTNMTIAVSVLLVECLCRHVGMFIERGIGSPGVPWFEKVLALCGLALFLKLTCRSVICSDFGVCLPNPGKCIATLLILASLIAMVWAGTRHFAFHQEFSSNRFLFMLTVSGVDEELVFRGAMPFLLKTKDGSSDLHRSINRVIVFVVPTAIFTLMHAWRLTNGHFVFSGFIFGVIGIGACAFMYLRLRTGSLLNSVIVHNAVNAGTVIALAAG